MSMDINQTKFNSQIEITDLIAEAVINASARRNQVLDAKEPLSELSENDEKSIAGGQRIVVGGLGLGLVIEF